MVLLREVVTLQCEVDSAKEVNIFRTADSQRFKAHMYLQKLNH